MNQRYRPRRSAYARTRFDVAGMTAQPAASRRAPATRVPAGLRAAAILLVILAVGALAAAQWFTGSAFRIQMESIRVSGNAGVPVAQIISASRLLGEHVLYADLDAAAAGVDDVPGIDAVRITCTWYGDTTCTVQVKVAQALAVWQTTRGLLWIDTEGKVQQADADMPSALKVRVESGDAPVVGSTVDSGLLRVMDELKDQSLGVKQFLYSSQYGMMFIDASGWRIRIGLADQDGDTARKLALARLVLNHLGAGDPGMAGTLDVRYLEAPYYVRADR